MADSKCYDSVLRRTFSTSLHPCSKQLSPEWKAVSTEHQRMYFYNLRTRSTHWFPPSEFWVSKLGLPYGWEAALDSKNIRYYINHVTRITTREDPRSEADQDSDVVLMASKTPPQARSIELVRDAAIGFGFVAGSEKPVVIRSVIPDGPSYEKLFANDQILRVNGEDVQDAAQEDVIKLIKSATGCIELEVVASEDVQDTKNQRHRKSSLMSRTTRERRRSTPVSVRFADESALVQVIGPTEAVRRSSVPLIPNVLKVFLENGQTRSFRYDSTTTVQEIFNSFGPKLDVKLLEHYSLVLSGPKKGQISYIQNHEKVSEIFTNRNCSSVNCLCKLNIAFVPKDHFELLKQDPNTFEYLYAQATNRVVDGFYGMDLKYDLAINLAALHIQQKALDAACGRLGKVSVRRIEREFGGLGKFVPADHLDSRRGKDMRKTLEQQIKLNENLACPGEKHMNSLQCKIHYLNLASDIFSYGGRYFNVELSRGDAANPGFTKVEKQRIKLLVNLKYGVSHVVRGKVNVQCQLADFKEITGFSSCSLGDGKQFLRIVLLEGKGIELICTSLDCLDLIALITGYYRLYVDNTSHKPLPVDSEQACPFGFQRNPPDVPEYYSKHRVVPDVWSYPFHFQVSDGKKKVLKSNSDPSNGHARYMVIDLSKAPPRFQESSIYEEPDDGNAGASRTFLNKENQHLPGRNTKEDTDSYILDSAVDSSNQVADEEEALLRAASSVLSDSYVASDNVSSDHRLDDATVETTEASSDQQLSLYKRRQNSPANLARNTPAQESLQQDNEDLKLEISLGEQLFEGKEARSEVEGEIDCIDVTDSSDVTYGSDSSAFVDIALHPEANNNHDDQTSLESMGYLSSSCSTLNQSEQVTQDESLSGRIERNFLPTKHPKTPTSEKATPELLFSKPAIGDQFFDTVPLSQLAKDDQFFDTAPLCDALNPSPPSSDLGFGETSFNNEEIVSTDLIDVEINNESEDVPSSPEGRVEVDDTSSTVEISGQSQGPVLKDGKRLSGQSEAGYSVSAKQDDLWMDSNNNRFSGTLDEESGTDSETVERNDGRENSDGSEESDFSEQEESLWSTFPEFFQPTSRIVSTSHKQAELNLSDEACDSNDMLRQSGSDQSVVLVSHRILNSSLSKETLTKEANDDESRGDCEDSSPAFDASDDSEFTYELNSDLSVKSLTATDQNEVGSMKKKINDCKGCYKQRTGQQKPWTNTSRVSSRSENADKECGVSLVSFLSGKVKALEEGKNNQVAQPNSFGNNSPPFAAISNKNPSGNVMASVLMTGAMPVPFEEVPSLVHRSYSPTDWIIPAPPTSTAELSDCDVSVVSPPPFYPDPSQGEDFDREITDLIVPPPPFSVSPVTTMNSALPPPTDLDESELLESRYDCSDARFFSLTGDCKLARKKTVETKRDSQSTLKEEQSSTSMQDKLGKSLTERDAVSMHRTITRLKKGTLLTAKDNDFAVKPVEETCFLHNSSLRASGLRLQSSVWDSSTVSSSNSTSVTWKTGYGSQERKELSRGGKEVEPSFEATCKELQETGATVTSLSPVATNFSAFVKREERSPRAKKTDGEQTPPILPKRLLLEAATSTRRTKVVASNLEKYSDRHVLVQSADCDTDHGRSTPREEGKLREWLNLESSDATSLLVSTADRGYSKEMRPKDCSALRDERKDVAGENLPLPEISFQLTDGDDDMSRSVGQTATSIPACSSSVSSVAVSSNRLEEPCSASQTPSGDRVREHSTCERETLLDCSSSMHTRNGVSCIEKGNTRDLCENGFDLSRSGFVLEDCAESEARSKNATRLASKFKAHSSAHIPACSSAALFVPCTISSAARSLKKNIPCFSTPYNSSSRYVNQNWKGASYKELEWTRAFPGQSVTEDSPGDVLGAERLSEASKLIGNHSESSPTLSATSRLAASNTSCAGSLNSSNEHETSLKHVLSSDSHLHLKKDVGLKPCQNLGIIADVHLGYSNRSHQVNDQIDTGNNQNTSERICTSHGEVPVANSFPAKYTISPPLTLPPLPDCPPPPLPTSPPPNVSPKLDDVDFDFDELLLELEP